MKSFRRCADCHRRRKSVRRVYALDNKQVCDGCLRERIDLCAAEVDEQQNMWDELMKVLNRRTARTLKGG
jgi:predicted Fe-S protein YdhL (DUF1289 family)